MCDYSLQRVRSRAAQAGEDLKIFDFGTGTKGFVASAPKDHEDSEQAVCLLPGTELSFPQGLPIRRYFMFGIFKTGKVYHTARFKQVDKENPNTHHDMVEFPDGNSMYLTDMPIGTQAVVLQLPAKPLTKSEEEYQKRAEYV